jgi:hypothetical protein
MGNQHNKEVYDKVMEGIRKGAPKPTPAQKKAEAQRKAEEKKAVAREKKRRNSSGDGDVINTGMFG